MIQKIENSKKNKQSRQQYGRCRWASPCQSFSTQSDQNFLELHRLHTLVSLQTPYHRHRHRYHQQAFQDCRSRFLLPMFPFLAAAFHQLKITFNLPTPIIPQRDRLRRDIRWNIRQQVPGTQLLAGHRITLLVTESTTFAMSKRNAIASSGTETE